MTDSVDCWVNVLAHPDLTVADLAEAGVTRISIGSGMSRAALGSLIDAGQEIQERGTFNFARSAPGFATIESMLSE
ncbi:MAG: hypothetical protein HKN91_10985 [Acidimicrobiia bacterium]|nr:hypothetical protein [Acidimicrobiia bacterium]